MQKGSAQLILIFTVTIFVVIGGFYFYSKFKKDNQVVLPILTTPKSSEAQEYSNQNLGFKFQYDKNFTVKEDTEQEFNKRGNGDFRKNFTGYVEYEPGKSLGAVVVLDKDDNYDKNPFTVWVFDNPDELSIDQWYQKYWYFPFVWGDFTSRGKIDYAPKVEATVSGQIGKSGIIDYQPDKPKFIYISKDKKIYLFRVIGNSGEQILSSVKLQ